MYLTLYRTNGPLTFTYSWKAVKTLFCACAEGHLKTKSNSRRQQLHWDLMAGRSRSTVTNPSFWFSEHLLRKPLTVIDQFHSHLEPMKFLRQDTFHDQVSSNVNTFRTGSFKLFKHPFPGFLTILTL